jgi:hypothetical protein
MKYGRLGKPKIKIVRVNRGTGERVCVCVCVYVCVCVCVRSEGLSRIYVILLEIHLNTSHITS